MSAAEHGVTAKLGQEREPWHCPELHEMIVGAALDGAHAMAAFQDGFMSSVCPITVTEHLLICLVSQLRGHARTRPCHAEML